ncbi:cytochrome P450 10 [Biomphalaria glabrata]|nr:cytochrome P450 10-like cytochrome P450 2J1-like P Metal binding and transport [Biomphalaria glabrata]
MIDVILVFVVVLSAMYWWTSQRKKGFPPEPGLSLPLIGHAHLIETDPTNQFIQWRKRLGDVFLVRYGYKQVVFINGYEAIHEALVKKHAIFMNRSDGFIHEVLFNARGVVSLPGGEWREQRTFLQLALKKLGMGRNVMAERIHAEIGHLLHEIDQSKGQPLDLRKLFTASVCNVICYITLGRRYDYDDKVFDQMIQLTLRQFEIGSPSSPLHFFYKIIRNLPWDFFYYREFMQIIKTMKAHFICMIQETVSDSRNDGHSVVHMFTAEMKKRKEAGSSSTFQDDNLLYNCWNFFNAGTETSSTTLHYGVLFLVNFPEIQEKLFEEIKEHVGTDHLPPWSSRKNLVLLNAFIYETQRLSSIIPLSLERMTASDSTIKGCFIPKGTVVIPVLDSLLWDEEVWGDPMNFRPERFLENGKLTVKKEFLPFSDGSRRCLGEPLAAMELFLFMAALIQRYKFVPEESGKMPAMGGRYGFSRTPHPFKVRALLRE